MSYEIKVNWKVFNVSTDHIEEYLRANFPEYTGSHYNSKGYVFTFDSEPSSQTKGNITSYWNNLNENSNEAKKYVSQSDYETALQTLIDNFDYTKDYSALTVNERKLIGNMSISKAQGKLKREDLGL